jgi:protein-disulfide isomerase
MDEEVEVTLTKKERKELAKQAKRKEREKQETIAKLKKFVLTVAVLVLVVILGYRFVNFINTPTSTISSEPLVVVEGENIKGDEEATATLVEYGDFQCPACATYYPIVKQLSEDFPEGLRIVYRHLPLVSIHPNAMPAAKAAEAAGVQGKFWEMHDILFEKQQEWSGDRNPKDKFVSYAEELELDIDAFNSDFDSRELQEKITGQMLTANRLGVNSTPTFFLNDTRITPRSYEEFKSAVEEAIKN